MLKEIKYIMEGNNFNQRLVVDDIHGISRTIIGQGHSGNEVKLIVNVDSKVSKERICKEDS